ncbi:hypothetical protein RIF29_19872 [Crotalaria pallida]|uniref:Uncharacterized protein n=1 Tax=Crotalaria pallida TaxID=3830 RepID=A0AAN9F0M6_CROPI
MGEEKRSRRRRSPSGASRRNQSPELSMEEANELFVMVFGSDLKGHSCTLVQPGRSSIMQKRNTKQNQQQRTKKKEARWYLARGEEQRRKRTAKKKNDELTSKAESFSSLYPLPKYSKSLNPENS